MIEREALWKVQVQYIFGLRIPGRRPNCGEEGATCNSGITEDLGQKQNCSYKSSEEKAAPTFVHLYTWQY